MLISFKFFSRTLPSLGAICLCLLASNPAQALALGDAAPAFSAPSLRDNSKVNLSDFRGKVVYLDFWASWCAPCRQAFPLLQQLRTELGPQGFEVLAVNVDADAADARRFFKERAVNYPVVGPVSDAVPTVYGVVGMPYGFVIDRKGTVRVVHEGFRPSEVDGLRKQIQQLLREGP